MTRWLKRLASRFDSVFQSDIAFIEQAYRDLLGRPPDQDGLNHYRRVLRDGVTRREVLLTLAHSPEFIDKHATARVPARPNIRQLRPDRYSTATDSTSGLTVPIFSAADPSDFDWLERMIREHHYYELPGVWNFGVDADKKLMAEIIESFAPKRALELGCASGAVLECLVRSGINAEGIEISEMAVARSSPGIRDRIHRGDLLELDLPHKYDVIFGLDIFEHLNPNRLDAYLARLRSLAISGATFFCNIPAFGRDPVFGEVFPRYLDQWAKEVAADRPFSTIHVDEEGFPIHGHLTWADWRWWVEQFERQGLRRETEKEISLHRKYDNYFDRFARARKAFFVFSAP